MVIVFDGRKTRDEILGNLEQEIRNFGKKPVLAVIMIGNDPVSLHYVELKRKIAERIGIETRLDRYSENATEDEVLAKIQELNNDVSVNGIMIQIPVPGSLNRDKLIEKIKPDKDVDGLRMCAGFDFMYFPPAILSIEEALRQSGVDITSSTVALIGQGFLIGDPMRRYLANRTKRLILADQSTADLSQVTLAADVIISAVGRAGLIRPEMIKAGTVLVDAGTSEVGGELKGDIDPIAYEKASFYTPVPGGIGPVTISYLMENTVDARKKLDQ